MMVKRSTRSGHPGASFSNGNMGVLEDQWSGDPLRPVHWWHWA